MAVSRAKTWSAGETLTAADLNAEFNNLINNSMDLGSPRTALLDLDGQQLVLDADADSYLVEESDDVLLLRLQGVDLFRWDGDVASPVNALTFTASATGVSTKISAIGSDTDIDLELVPKGAASVIIDGTIKLKEQADAESDDAAYGQLWINTATPAELYYTDDAGTDANICTTHRPARARDISNYKWLPDL